jgi:hypothetical protein
MESSRPVAGTAILTAYLFFFLQLFQFFLDSVEMFFQRFSHEPPAFQFLLFAKTSGLDCMDRVLEERINRASSARIWPE